MIELQNISVDHGGVRALDSVSASIGAGEVTALAGQNGSGKSTLLGVIAGTQAHRGALARRPDVRVAFVVQRSAVPHSLPLTVRDVVSMGRWGRRAPWRPLTRADREIVQESLAALGLQSLERRPLHELSGGQRQRALVAQGLAQRADILLLDEPAAALDDEARVLIGLAIAREAERGAAVVHATHDAAAIAAADRVIRLHAGQLAAP
ncbi:zinc ABC transporter ATP-binding protein AztA [Conyzicola sp.]|uniref:zinc ABC transporter ATP-binding protein AztA n=1 Tax=Conyzicola sp. TaxID=1969404 RepID=UPI003989048B